MPISLILADDHPLVIDALTSLFSAENDFTVLAVCRSGEEIVPSLQKHKPDLLLLDLRMPGKDGLAVLKEIRNEKIATRTVLLTAELNQDELAAAVRLGAGAVLLKDVAPELIVQCLRDVYAGKLRPGEYSPGKVLDHMVQGGGKRRDAFARLSRRELEILSHVAAGLHNAEIGKRLFISEGTVKIHLHTIFKKTGLHSRVALVVSARENGIL